MTVIAFDGKTLCADKRTTSHGLIYTVTKIGRIRGHLVGSCGNGGTGRELRAWFEDGAKPSDAKRELWDKATLLAITPDGRVLHYDDGPIPVEFEGRTVAIGSGRDYAMAFMHVGYSAFDAVRLTCELNADCGEGIDALPLMPETRDLHVVGSDAPRWE